MRETRKNAAGDKVWKFPSTPIPEPVMRGVRGWRTSEGYLVVRVHYTADPVTAEPGWKETVAQEMGYRGGVGGRDWEREMEIDFSMYSGDPIYPGFNHSSITVTQYNPHLPLFRGWDFGFRNPACVWLQHDEAHDRLHYLHEIFPTLDKSEVPGLKITDFIALVEAETERLFPEATNVRDYGDPSGTQHQDKSDLSSFEFMIAAGLSPQWSVVGRLNRIAYARPYVEGGVDKFRINPHCKLAIEGFSGAYRRPSKGSGRASDEMPDLSDKVQREPYIHIQDAFEYVVGNTLSIETKTFGEKRKEAERKEKRQLVGDLASMYLQGMERPSEFVTPLDPDDPKYSDPLHLDPADLLRLDMDESEKDQLEVDITEAFLY